MYRNNWKVLMWTEWRKSVGKPSIKVTSDELFCVVSDMDFSDYFQFLDHHSALFPSERNEFFFKDCELLRYYSTKYKSLPYNKIYGCIFCILNDSLISEISSWILKHVVL